MLDSISREAVVKFSIPVILGFVFSVLVLLLAMDEYVFTRKEADLLKESIQTNRHAINETNIRIDRKIDETRKQIIEQIDHSNRQIMDQMNTMTERILKFSTQNYDQVNKRVDLLYDKMIRDAAK